MTTEQLRRMADIVELLEFAVLNAYEAPDVSIPVFEDIIDELDRMVHPKTVASAVA